MLRKCLQPLYSLSQLHTRALSALAKGIGLIDGLDLGNIVCEKALLYSQTR